MIEFDYDKIMKENVVVHCDTEEKANNLLLWADSKGLKWSDYKSYKYNFWNVYWQKTCYDLYNGEFTNYNYYKNNNYKIYKYEDVILKNINKNIVECIECDKCRKLMKIDSEDFYTIRGNLMIGLNGGLIGNNFDKDDKCVRENCYCINCFKKIINVERESNDTENMFKY
jgi:hypothetical protein